MNLIQWLEHIRGLHRKEIDLTLDRIKKVAQSLDLIHFNCPTIMVGGTNGKGTCIKALEAIYHHANFKVGCYTSPHILQFNERICIAKENVSDHELCEAFDVIENARAGESLTFFEFTTLAAFYLFKRASLDVLLLEVGLGGRLDAVNIVEPDVSIITSIGLDHVDRLGSTRAAIGFEKAGIFRGGKVAICGDPEPPQTVIEHANNIGTQLFCIGKDFSPKLPELQVDKDNVITALAAVEVLQEALPTSQDSIQHALSQLQLSGRFQQISELPPVIVDVAHNPAAVKRFANKLQQKGWQQVDAIVGMLEDKLISESLEALLPLVKNWYLVDLSQHPRGAKPAQLEEGLSRLGIKNWYTCATVAQAYEKALVEQVEDSPLVVFGSFHMVAAAQSIFNAG